MEISVIVPVYNVEKYLNRCIDSILAQTFTDFELLLIDDGSTDNSGKLCDEYAAKDKRVRVFHKENGGAASARNMGLTEASGEYIAFIDSDDWVDRTYLEVLFRICVENGVDLGCCGHQTTAEYTIKADIKENSITIYTPEEFWCYSQSNAAIVWGKLFAKKLFDGVRFPEGVIIEDELTTHKAIFQCQKLVCADAVLYYYFVNESSVMHTKWSTKNLVAFQAYREQCEFFLEHGFLEAFKCSNRAYVFMIYFMFCESVVVPKEYKKYKRITLRRWKQDFKRWRKSDLLKNNKKYRWPFLWFYPIKIGLIDNVKDVIKQGGLKAVKEKIKEHKRKKALFKENYKDK